MLTKGERHGILYKLSEESKSKSLGELPGRRKSSVEFSHFEANKNVENKIEKNLQNPLTNETECDILYKLSKRRAKTKEYGTQAVSLKSAKEKRMTLL